MKTWRVVANVFDKNAKLFPLHTFFVYASDAGTAIGTAKDIINPLGLITWIQIRVACDREEKEWSNL